MESQMNKRGLLVVDSKIYQNSLRPKRLDKIKRRIFSSVSTGTFFSGKNVTLIY